MYKRNILILLAIVICCFLFNCAGTGYKFKNSYSSNHIYNMTTLSETKSEIDYLNNDELVKTMQEKGITLPMKIDMTQYMLVIAETDSEKIDGSFPLTIDFEKVRTIQKLNGQEINTPPPKNFEGLKIYSTNYKDNRIKVEKIEGVDIDDYLKNSFSQMIEKLTQNIKYPENPIKIGDEFTQEATIQMPLADLPPINIKIISDYKLMQVKDSLAFFDVSEKFELLHENKGMDIEVSGDGDGKLIHDLSKNFYIENNSKATVISLVKTGMFTMEAKAVVNLKRSVEIIDK